MKNFVQLIIALGLALFTIWAVHGIIEYHSAIKSPHDLVVFHEVAVIAFLLVGLICDKILKYAVVIIRALQRLNAGENIELVHNDYTQQFLPLFFAVIISACIYVVVIRIISIH
jgi:hypothetical protein